jgi:hypothetical protein
MPTDSFKEMLDRDRAKVEARELIDAASPLLRELVNYATHACIRCMRAPDSDRQGAKNEDMAPNRALPAAHRADRRGRSLDLGELRKRSRSGTAERL